MKPASKEHRSWRPEQNWARIGFFLTLNGAAMPGVAQDDYSTEYSTSTRSTVLLTFEGPSQNIRDPCQRHPMAPTSHPIQVPNK
jgi:hypothetical protein